MIAWVNVEQMLSLSPSHHPLHIISGDIINNKRNLCPWLLNVTSLVVERNNSNVLEAGRSSMKNTVFSISGQSV